MIVSNRNLTSAWHECFLTFCCINGTSIDKGGLFQSGEAATVDGFHSDSGRGRRGVEGGSKFIQVF